MLTRNTMEWSDLVQREGFCELLEGMMKNDDRMVGQYYLSLKEIAEKHGIDEQAFVLFFVALCELMGGFQVYFPKKSKLENTIKKHLIFSEFDGQNYADLARKYRISEDVARKYIREVGSTMKALRNDVAPLISKDK
ncbi:Mor transcription activator family protein [Vibrio vulnificus]|uniref:Mor transcription activator family protein n=1 Tax=Vibrio vulnificus TaxID=672 RepID=UPI0035688291